MATPCDRLILWRVISFLVPVHHTSHTVLGGTRHTFIHSPPHATAQRRRYHLIVSFPHISLNSSRATPRNTNNIPSSLSEGTQRSKEVLILINSYTSSFARAPVWDDRELRFFVRTLKKQYIYPVPHPTSPPPIAPRTL